jgi:hypothetical protein
MGDEGPATGLIYQAGKAAETRMIREPEDLLEKPRCDIWNPMVKGSGRAHLGAAGALFLFGVLAPACGIASGKKGELT